MAPPSDNSDFTDDFDDLSEEELRQQLFQTTNDLATCTQLLHLLTLKYDELRNRLNI